MKAEIALISENSTQLDQKVKKNQPWFDTTYFFKGQVDILISKLVNIILFLSVDLYFDGIKHIC